MIGPGNNGPVVARKVFAKLVLAVVLGRAFFVRPWAGHPRRFFEAKFFGDYFGMAGISRIADAAIGPRQYPIQDFDLLQVARARSQDLRFEFVDVFLWISTFIHLRSAPRPAATKSPPWM